MGFDVERFAVEHFASCFGVPPLPRLYALSKIRVGSAVVTYAGCPIGKVRRFRGGVNRGRWSFTTCTGMVEGPFNTRSKAAQVLVWWHEDRIAVQPDRNDAVRMGGPVARVAPWLSSGPRV